MKPHPLIARLDRIHPGYGEYAFCPLGQLGFAVKLGDDTLWFDPYLSPDRSRLVPPALPPSALTGATLVLGSHDHGDHIDRPAWPEIAAASPEARFVVPEAVRAGIPLPPERLIGLDDMRTVEWHDIRITGIAAAHEFLDRDAAGRYPYLGFVVEGNGVTIYHSGDCCVYEGLRAKLASWEKFDLVFLPINGRDARRLKRNCIGNMTYQEAADLAGDLRPGLTVPGHFDMFAMNPGDPRAFADYMKVKYPGLACLRPVPGRMVRGKAGKDTL